MAAKKWGGWENRESQLGVFGGCENELLPCSSVILTKQRNGQTREVTMLTLGTYTVPIVLSI